MRYYLNIGSNLGDRWANLYGAIVALARGAGGWCLLSDVVRSDPWGFESANGFLNVGVAIDSDHEPMAVLRWIQSIERALGSAAHRDAQGGYVDRVVDIDIMAIDSDPGVDGRRSEIVIDTDILKTPHQHLAERPFFMKPLQQLRSR
ncbi:MAG: 2-amino-4-hydroxy-6-hydroxymethyldihydropteridine diphosphokinase [Muribaculaceae bacterium]|nr:2-amino-4-hydroxy-6-hydroxymethyldihydropteridine diphosphokinase [Muribaculaceae bacterium]